MNTKSDKTASILSSEKFQQLLRLRRTVRFSLAFLVLALHVFFVGGIAFYKQWFSQPIFETSSITVGIVAAVTVIVFMVLVEAIYIWVSKKVFDPLQKQVLLQANLHE